MKHHHRFFRRKTAFSVSAQHKEVDLRTFKYFMAKNQKKCKKCTQWVRKVALGSCTPVHPFPPENISVTRSTYMYKHL